MNEEVTLNPGQSSDGNPPPTYRWRKVGAGFISLPSDNSWHSLGRVALSDFGVYQCVASNSFGSVIIKEVKLVRARLEIRGVNGAPLGNVAINTSAPRGEFLLLNLNDQLVVDSEPPATIKWFEKPSAVSSGRWEITNALERRGVSVARDAVALLAVANEDDAHVVKVKFENPTALISKEAPPWNIKVII